MKHIIKISVVNFHTSYGNKEVNLQKIKDYIEIASCEGVDLLVFPNLL
ncbi:hypothetical protein AGATL06_24950 [Agathobaculum sp. TL06]